MASVNKAIVVGNLGSDPEMTSVNGTVVAKFPIATNARWTDRNGDKQERVEWHNVTAWGRTAEVARDYLKRGSPVYVEGRLQTDSWEADKDGMQHACGRKHYKTHIVVERCHQRLNEGGDRPVPSVAKREPHGEIRAGREVDFRRNRNVAVIRRVVLPVKNAVVMQIRPAVVDRDVSA